MKKTNLILITAIVAAGVIACGKFYINHQFRNTYQDANALLHSDSTKTVFLKAHMKNGDVYVFDSKWAINTEQTILSGYSAHYDFNRKKLEVNTFDIPISDVAIFETNRPIANVDDNRIVGLTVMTVIDAVGGITCLTNPKACFGSCPTFYFQNDNNLNYANAEGFSASIAPSLESGDLDALNNPRLKDRDFVLTMKNEAMETHAVNEVKLIAVQRKEGQRIFHDRENNFYASDKIISASAASASEGDITQKIKSMDDAEWFCLADSNDLKEKEIINLSFINDGSKKKSGLVINFRQTLLTTFLLYSAYGYMGDEVGDVFAKIETDKNVRGLLKDTKKILGEIEVYVFNDQSQQWQPSGSLHETGPIAKNLEMVPLPEECRDQREIKIQLRLSKGLWRIDYVALATIANAVAPTVLSPCKVFKNGLENNAALSNLSFDDKKYQPSVPGDVYKMHFMLPDSQQDYELFVFSKGYYLEWIRQEWLREKNLPKLRNMLQEDKATWHSLAKEFKNVEAGMEATFWGSKISQ